MKILVLCFVLFSTLLLAEVVDTIEVPIGQSQLDATVNAKLDRNWGDMFKASWDVNGNNVLDNAERLAYLYFYQFAQAPKQILDVKAHFNGTNETQLSDLLPNYNEYDCLFIDNDVIEERPPLPPLTKYVQGDIVQKLLDPITNTYSWYKITNFLTQGTNEVIVLDETYNSIFMSGVTQETTIGKFISLNNLKDIDTSDLQNGVTLVWDNVTQKWKTENLPASGLTDILADDGLLDTSLSQQLQFISDSFYFHKVNDGTLELGLTNKLFFNKNANLNYNQFNQGVSFYYITNETNDLSTALQFYSMSGTTGVSAFYRFKLPNKSDISQSLVTSGVTGEIWNDNNSLFINDGQGALLAGGKKVALSDHVGFYHITSFITTLSELNSWLLSANRGDYGLVLDTVAATNETLVDGDIISKRGSGFDLIGNFKTAAPGSYILGLTETGNFDDFKFVVSNGSDYDTELGNLIKLGDLKDVSLYNVATHEVLSFNGSEWVNTMLTNQIVAKGTVYRSMPMLESYGRTLLINSVNHSVSDKFTLCDIRWYVPDDYGITWYSRVTIPAPTTKSIIGCSVANSISSISNLILVYGGQTFNSFYLYDLTNNVFYTTEATITYKYDVGVCLDNSDNVIAIGGNLNFNQWKTNTVYPVQFSDSIEVYDKQSNYQLTQSVTLASVYGPITKEIAFTSGYKQYLYPIVRQIGNLFVKTITIRQDGFNDFIKIYTSETGLNGSWQFVSDLKLADQSIKDGFIYQQPDGRYILIAQSPYPDTRYRYFVSNDLVTWTDKGFLQGVSMSLEGNDGCSVTFNSDDGLYHLFVRAPSSLGEFFHYTSTTGEIWTLKAPLAGFTKTGLTHPMCVYDSSDHLYKMFYFAYGDHTLNFAQSSDGINFNTIVTYRPTDPQFDNQITELYQISFLYDTTEAYYRFWDMAKTTQEVWSSAYMTGETITDFHFVDWDQLAEIATAEVLVNNIVGASNIHTITSTNSSGETTIMFLGGLFAYNSTDTTVNTICSTAPCNLIWNITTNTTVEINSTKLPITPLWYFDSVDQKVYFIGQFSPVIGSDTDVAGFEYKEISTEINVYDIATDSWSTLPNYPDKLPPKGTCLIYRDTSGNKFLYVYNTSPDDDYKSYVYNFSTNAWTQNQNVASNLFVDLSSYNFLFTPKAVVSPVKRYTPDWPLEQCVIEDITPDHVLFSTYYYDKTTNTMKRSPQGQYSFIIISDE